ncbi:hypothetical protein RZS08_49430, partial [Arthrospira platensis SPKY1]|nr:hypothetical protein [Arthrospira platensis SPKY1]
PAGSRLNQQTEVNLLAAQVLPGAEKTKAFGIEAQQHALAGIGKPALAGGEIQNRRGAVQIGLAGRQHHPGRTTAQARAHTPSQPDPTFGARPRLKQHRLPRDHPVPGFA